MATSSFNKHFVVKSAKASAVLSHCLANPKKVSAYPVNKMDSEKGVKLLKQYFSV